MQIFVKRLALAGVLVTALGGCAVLGFSSGVNVSVLGANYTDDYLGFTIYSVSGKNLGIGGYVKEFSAGGTSGIVCCAVIPNPGRTIRIKWKVGEDEVSHTKDIVVLACMLHKPTCRRRRVTNPAIRALTGGAGRNLPYPQ